MRHRFLYTLVIAYLLLTSLVSPSLAEETPSTVLPVIPEGWVEVTVENKARCIEFYEYNSKTYCNTEKATETVPEGKPEDYERWKVVFDNRVWKPGWGKNTEAITTVEYVVGEETVENWRELITTQFIPGLQNKVTVEDFISRMMASMIKQGYNPDWKIIRPAIDTIPSPKDMMFEFKLKDPESEAQHEIQRIVADDHGLYILHYVKRVPELTPKNREKWIGLLEKAEIRPLAVETPPQPPQSTPPVTPASP